VDEREFELINIIGGPLGPNQRDISRQMDLSLGMTNMLIHRLLTKGYIRIKQLNKKKVEYILTPKGFAEKMQKSIKYTMRTINSIGIIKKTLGDILATEYAAGQRKFYILGQSDLAGLIEMVLKEKFNDAYEIVHVNEITAVLSDGVVLICREDVVFNVSGVKTIDIIHELAKDEAVIAERGAA